MTVKISAIKRMVETGCAVDISNAPGIKRRPYNSTVIFDAVNRYGQLSGLVIRDDETGQLYAVIGRTNNLSVLAV